MTARTHREPPEPCELAAVVARSSLQLDETFDRLQGAVRLTAEEFQAQRVPQGSPALAGDLVLHASRSVTTLAAQLMADRARAAGVPLLVTVRAPTGLLGPTRFAGVPFAAFRHLECVAIRTVVQASHTVLYLQQDGVVAIGGSALIGRRRPGVVLAVQSLVVPDHCDGDRLLGSLGADASVVSLHPGLLQHTHETVAAGLRGGHGWVRELCPVHLAG